MTVTTIDRFSREAVITLSARRVPSTSRHRRTPVGADIYVYLRDKILGYDPRSIEEPAQAWFWTAEWQAKETQADRDLAEGRFKTFATSEEFIADLDADD